MKVEIQSVADKGNFEKERLVLKVIADTEIGDFLVIQTGFYDGSLTVGIYETFWFPYKSVSTGDLVILYTKSGKDSEKLLKQGRRAHFFYWGLSSAIWNKKDRASVLLHAPEWTSKSPAEL